MIWMNPVFVGFSWISETMLYTYLNDVRTILANYKVLATEVH